MLSNKQKELIEAFKLDAAFIVFDAADEMDWFRQCGGVPGNYAETAKNYEAKYGDSGDGWKAIMEADMTALNRKMERFTDLNKVLGFPPVIVKELFGF